MENKDFLCGVIEGYYGRPWTFEQRNQLFQYCSKFGLNSYVYAPKDDDKHRSRWRDLYDENEFDQLKNLINQSKQMNIQFIYALSPGLDMKYSLNEDFQYLTKKFDQLKSMGCEHWALLFDDIENEMSKEDQEEFSSFANAQVFISNRLFEYLQQPKIFLFCPTEYCSRMASPSLTESSYLQTIGQGLHSQIQIFWTGPKVVSRRITTKHLDEVNQLLKRRVTIWENLNANDYDQRRLCLGPFSGRSTRILSKLSGILINPNCEFELNYIPLNTLGQWFKCCSSNSNSNSYRVDLSLRQAIDDWFPHFNQNKITLVTFDDIQLLIDLFYLPYENGRRAQQLFNEFSWLRFHSNCLDRKIEWKDRLNRFEEKAKEVHQLHQHLISMSNRSILYDIYHYILDMNSTISLCTKYLRWIENDDKSSSSIFMSGDVEPWCIRGGLAGEFLNLLPLGNFQSTLKKDLNNLSRIFYLRSMNDDDQNDLLHLCRQVHQHDQIDQSEEFFSEKLIKEYFSQSEKTFDQCFVAENDQGNILSMILSIENLQQFDQKFRQNNDDFVEYPSWISENYPIRLVYFIDLKLKSEEIYHLTTKMFELIFRQLKKKGFVGSHILIDERERCLHEYLYRQDNRSEMMSKDIRMNNGEKIPSFAFGTYQIPNEEINDILSKALQIGYRHFDCAWIYQNEISIGNFLQKQFDQQILKRSDLFLTSKLWCSFHRRDRVRQQCLITIDQLQCQYLDLFLIHWPIAFQDQDPSLNQSSSIDIDDQIDFIDTWKSMEMLVDEGLVKSIGLSNFNQEQIERILQICKHKPVVNQVEIHPYCPQDDLEDYCHQHDILLAAYAPLGGANQNPFIDDNAPVLLKDPIIGQLAEKYSCHSSEILLRYILDRHFICIVKSSNLQRIEENFRVFQLNRFHLTEEDFKLIKDHILTRYRYYLMKDGFNSKYHPFNDWKHFIPSKY